MHEILQVENVAYSSLFRNICQRFKSGSRREPEMPSLAKTLTVLKRQ